MISRFQKNTYLCHCILNIKAKIMEVMVDIIDNGALRLLHDMEFLKLIRVKTPVIKEKKKALKLSEKFAGALHLSDEQYENFQMTIKRDRDEWERSIY
jgi:hypothetical protein